MTQFYEREFGLRGIVPSSQRSSLCRKRPVSGLASDKTEPNLLKGVAARSIKKPRSDLFPRRRARSASAIARSRKSGQFGAIFGFAGLLLRLRPIGLAVRATPSAPSKAASRHFIPVASSPPLRGGECSFVLGKIETESVRPRGST